MLGRWPYIYPNTTYFIANVNNKSLCSVIVWAPHSDLSASWIANFGFSHETKRVSSGENVIYFRWIDLIFGLFALDDRLWMTDCLTIDDWLTCLRKVCFFQDARKFEDGRAAGNNKQIATFVNTSIIRFTVAKKDVNWLGKFWWWWKLAASVCRSTIDRDWSRD